MKLLILLLLSFSTFAGNYIPKSKVGDCTQKTVYTKPQGEDYISVPKGYNCKTAKLDDELIDDYKKPINSKNEIETCVDKKDCKTKQKLKKCSDKKEKVLIAKDFSEIYCSKFLRFKKRLSGRKIVVEDSAKKKAFEDDKLAKESKRLAINFALKAMACGKRVIATLVVQNAPKKLKKKQIKAMNKTYRDIKELLDTGSLDSAREEISAVVADGVLITDADKVALLAALDACKP